MKTIDCPILGRCAVSEFVIRGVLECEPEQLGDRSPGNWVFERHSLPMVRTEWWFHTASQMWFTVRRDTGSDEILEVSAAHG